MRRKDDILCVDDEPRVIQGLTDLLDAKFTVHTAQSGAEGLQLLRKNSAIVVVLSDMRMPEMDGAAFLEQVRTVAPTATRMLLTGYSDMEAAIAAVNRGQIFRFLTKPCAPEDMFLAIDAAVEQHRLITAEKVLLHNTLTGSLKALMQVLAMTNPLAFGRALRLKKLVRSLAAQAAESSAWHWEVAALVCQVGCINLPEATLMKLNIGDALDQAEQREYDTALRGSISLVEKIPRLEPVIEILTDLRKPAKHSNALAAPIGTRALRIALDYDALEARGWEKKDILASLRLQLQIYDGKLVDALERSLDAGDTCIVEVLSIEELTDGMVVAEDVCRRNGVLILPRGITITPNVLDHLRKHATEVGAINVRTERQLSAA